MQDAPPPTNYDQKIAELEKRFMQKIEHLEERIKELEHGSSMGGSPSPLNRMDPYGNSKFADDSGNNGHMRLKPNLPPDHPIV